MTVLRFTPGGIVRAPTALQVRLTRAGGARIPVGVPAPSRDLRPEEVQHALAVLVRDRRGPRVRPCDRLILSGHLPPAGPDADALGDVLARARTWGLRHVTAHQGRGPAAPLPPGGLRAQVDAWVVVVSDMGDVQAAWRAAREGPPLSVVVPLDDATLPHLDRLARALVPLPLAGIALAWPLVGAPPRAPRVRAALVPVVARLRAGGHAPHVRGLPPCVVPPGARPARRSRNRFWVDADHPPETPLVFQPDLVRYSKPDPCRRCAADPVCDGVPDGLEGRVGSLHPLADPLGL